MALENDYHIEGALNLQATSTIPVVTRLSSTKYAVVTLVSGTLTVHWLERKGRTWTKVGQNTLESVSSIQGAPITAWDTDTGYITYKVGSSVMARPYIFKGGFGSEVDVTAEGDSNTSAVLGFAPNTSVGVAIGQKGLSAVNRVGGGIAKGSSTEHYTGPSTVSELRTPVSSRHNQAIWAQRVQGPIGPRSDSHRVYLATYADGIWGDIISRTLESGTIGNGSEVPGNCVSCGLLNPTALLACSYSKPDGAAGADNRRYRLSSITYGISTLSTIVSSHQVTDSGTGIKGPSENHHARIVPWWRTKYAGILILNMVPTITRRLQIHEFHVNPTSLGVSSASSTRPILTDFTVNSFDTAPISSTLTALAYASSEGVFISTLVRTPFEVEAEEGKPLLIPRKRYPTMSNERIKGMLVNG